MFGIRDTPEYARMVQAEAKVMLLQSLLRKKNEELEREAASARIRKANNKTILVTLTRLVDKVEALLA